MFSINILVSNFVLISVLTEGIIVYFRVGRELLTDLYNIALLFNCGSRKRDKRVWENRECTEFTYYVIM